jgi:hypothetical protein
LPQTVRIRDEAIAAAPIVERVEEHREPVVAEYLLALAQDAGRDLARILIVEPRAYVERVGVVHQIDDRSIAGRRIFGGLDLVQILDLRRETPRFLVEYAVDDGRACDANDADGLRARTVGNGFLRRPFCGCKAERGEGDEMASR